MKSKTIDIWEQIVSNPPEHYREYFEAERAFLTSHVKPDFIVLDLGSGNGRTMKAIAPLVQKIVGIDNDGKAVESAKKELEKIENAEVFLEDAEKTHFSDEAFDIVFTGLTFVNFGSTKSDILKEIKRILKKNGMFIFSVYHERALPLRESTYGQYDTYSVIDKKGTVKFDSHHATSEQFDQEEISRILKDVGFKINKIETGSIHYLIACTKE